MTAAELTQGINGAGPYDRFQPASDSTAVGQPAWVCQCSSDEARPRGRCPTFAAGAVELRHRRTTERFTLSRQQRRGRIGQAPAGTLDVRTRPVLETAARVSA